MDSQVHAQCRCPIAGRRRQFQRARYGPMASFAIGKWKVQRKTIDCRRCAGRNASTPNRQPSISNATERTGFYGLGWNVGYDDHGRLRMNHSGGFDLGAATVVNLVPEEHLGIVVLTNGSPIGLPEA